MNALQKDIIHLISRHGPMTSSQLQDRLNTTELGYNFELEHISKTASKMKSNGLLVGEDRPNPGTKPVRYWALPEPVSEESLAAEMASDVAEVEQAPEIPAPDYEPSSVAFVLHKKPMSVRKALSEYAGLGHDEDRYLGAFMDGIAAAERHHGIAE
jgi:hypothetical protein